MKRLLIALLAAATAWVTPLRAEKDLSQDQVAAYVAVVKADLARDAGSVEEARRLYQEAADLYTAIAKKDPAWHPDIVEFRLTYCQSQLEALRGRPEGTRPPESPAEPGGGDVATAEALQRLALLEEENKQLHEQAVALETELSTLSNRLDQVVREQQAPAAPSGKSTKSGARDVEKAQKELQTCQAARAEMEQQLAALEAQLKHLSGATAGTNAAAIKADFAALRERLEESARQLDLSRDAAMKLLQPAAEPAP